jgi:hypothetical protein
MKPRNLPQFVIVGAPKCATSWLVVNLRKQRDIFMPAPELHYFNRNYDKGVDWYCRMFDGARDNQLIGEKSASYLADPAVPGRMKQLLPDAKLIVQIRNPVDRAYSDYCMLLRRGEVTMDVRQYLDPARAGQSRFLRDGLYAHHIASFLEFYPADRIKILLHEEIQREPGKAFMEVADFLGLQNASPPALVTRRVKDKAAATLPGAVRRILRPVKHLAAPYRERPWFRRAHALLAREISYPVLDRDMRAGLRDYYADDVSALSKLLGRDLTGWLGAVP